MNVFFSWMVKHRHLPSNPAADVELPRVPKGLRDPMTASEVEAVLALPDLTYAQGLRDRAMLELFYATGIRRMELSALSLHDIERERGTLHVRRGKGRKDRFVPIGERALAWVDKYVREARPLLQGDPHEAALFINIDGKRLSMGAMSWRVRSYLDKAGVHKAGACHLFRHTMATVMLDNGADIRHPGDARSRRHLHHAVVHARVDCEVAGGACGDASGGAIAARPGAGRRRGRVIAFG